MFSSLIDERGANHLWFMSMESAKYMTAGVGEFPSLTERKTSFDPLELNTDIFNLSVRLEVPLGIPFCNVSGFSVLHPTVFKSIFSVFSSVFLMQKVEFYNALSSRFI